MFIHLSSPVPLNSYVRHDQRCWSSWQLRNKASSGKLFCVLVIPLYQIGSSFFLSPYIYRQKYMSKNHINLVNRERGDGRISLLGLKLMQQYIINAKCCSLVRLISFTPLVILSLAVYVNIYISRLLSTQQLRLPPREIKYSSRG